MKILPAVLLIGVVVAPLGSLAQERASEPESPPPPAPESNVQPESMPSPPQESAVEPEPVPAPAEQFFDQVMDSVQIHGFVSQGFMWTTDNNYLAKTSEGTFEFSEAGINFNAEVVEDLSVGLQLFAYDLGDQGNYEVKLDWAYINYAFFDWLQVSAGRIKLKYGLYGEILDIDSARVPILLPQGLYDSSQRDLSLAGIGLKIHGVIPMGPLGNLAYELLYGSRNNQLVQQVAYLRFKRAIQAHLIWETPLPGLRLGANIGYLALDVELAFPDQDVEDALIAMGMLPADYSGQYIMDSPDLWAWNAYLEYNAYDLLFSLELLNVFELDQPTQDAFVAPPRKDFGLYGQAAYRFFDWLQISTYYSVFYKDVDDPKGTSVRFLKDHHAWQKDLALTIRFDIKDFWLIKLEGHYIDGTAGIVPTGGGESDRATQRWGLLMAKTTVAF